MKKQIIKSINQLDKKETKILNNHYKDNKIKIAIYEKVPEPLLSTLQLAFIKAFHLIFIHGTKIIEKTFDKENVMMEFDLNDYSINQKITKRHLKNLDKHALKSNFINKTITSTTGLTLGILGMGLPDIPLLVGTLLKGVYEIALSYGFSYVEVSEKIYILRLIRLSLSSDGEEKLILNSKLELLSNNDDNLDKEISETAQIMANELLVEKFIQGIPLIGIIGGIVNYKIYEKVTKLAVIKYKKRYLKHINESSIK